MPILLAFLLLASPTAEELIRAAMAADKIQDDKGWKFTYREEKQEFHREKNGTLMPGRSLTFDVIMLEGEPYRKLLLIDGKPLDPRAQKQVDDDLEKARAERKKRPHLSLSREVTMGDLDQLLALFDNTVTGEETIRGRKAWCVESLPKANHKPASRQEQDAMSTKRTTWFDQEEGVQLKRIDYFIKAASGFQPGCEFETNFSKIGDAWLIDSYHMRYDVKFIAFVRARGETHYRYYDYKRFEVESKVIVQ